MHRDELLYSILSRYHKASGNIYYAHTTEDIYGRKTIRSSIYLPSNISSLINNVFRDTNISEEYIILNHTLYPFYTAFLSKEKSKKILNSMKGYSGRNIYNTVGICATSISTPLYLKFCPKCLEEDIKKYGEPYWHRIHQVPCVKVCPEHKIILENSTVKINSFNKQEYISPSKKNCIIRNKSVYSEEILDKLYNLSKDVVELLNKHYTPKEYSWYRNNYINYLMEKELATPKRRIRRKQLMIDFKEFYGEEFLKLVECDFDILNTNNWLTSICTKHGNITHPIRHLLFIRYLGISIDDIHNYKYEFKPFGNGPWPCLNKASNHYKKDTIQNVTINYSRATQRITGNFKCKCGYTYLKEYKVNSDDKYKKTRVLKFGQVWENKLKALVKENELSIQEIGYKLDLDWISVYNQILKLGLEPNFKTTSKRVKEYINKTKKQHKVINHDILDDNKIYIYRKQLLILLNKYPNKSRTQIKNLNRKIYVYLQKHDRNWLEDNLPQKINKCNTKNTVDWDKRDNKILGKIKKFIKELNIEGERPRWININIIGKSLNIYTLLEKNLDKLPNTKNYLESVIETRDEYRIKKITWAINDIVDKGDGKLNMTRVSLKAGVSVKDKKWKDIVRGEIRKYNDKI